MHYFTHVGRTRRSWLILPILIVVLVFVSACGRGTRKNPTSPVVRSTLVPSPDYQPSTSVVEGVLKIGVNVEGMYEITSTDIKKLMPGWGNVDPMRLRLGLRGQSQPIWIKTQGDDYSLIFYGQPSDSRYTDENAYLLAGNDGEPLLMGEKPFHEASASPVESFFSTFHFEENHVYSPQVKDGDHFFWFSLPARKKQDIAVDLPKIATGIGHLRIAIWGSTESSSEFDHHLLISLNDQLLIDEKWDGAGWRILDADIPAGLLKDKDNTVLLATPGDTGAAAEINYLDWIEILYPRQAEADNDFLASDIPADSPDFSLQLSQFSGSIQVVDVTVPTETVRISGITGDKELVFTGEAGHRYLAIGPNGFSKPVHLMTASLSPDLRAPDSGADYIVIGPQELLQPLSPLLDWRASQGLKGIAVPLEAVYDQFNGGMTETDAIRAFMTYAVRSWHPAPRYLLLVGDATYDPRGYISSPEANRLPVLFVQTDFGGETASDVLLGDVNGDQRPDLAVGRMPAQNADQLRILVNKILGYEQSPTFADWRLKILAIADGQDANFKNDAQAFLNRVGAPYTGMMYAPEAGVKDAPAKVKAYFDEGYGLIAYFGHGSINMWGKDRIFMAEDVASLSNNMRLPVVINMTCLTGLFIHPKVTSLTENMLWYEKGGAVAMLAPTSLTLPSSQSFLSQALVDIWMKNPDATLGEVYLQAQQMIPITDAGAQEVLLTFLLFGDPALKIGGK